MLAVINPGLSTVAVTSLKAYIFLSAGTSSSDCPAKAKLCFSTNCLNSCREKDVLNPGMDSSLSKVPPVCPKPRPEIIGTISPKEAAIGASIKLILSPTPPVECLSATGRHLSKLIVPPESI